jgi:hypothetical protein
MTIIHPDTNLWLRPDGQISFVAEPAFNSHGFTIRQLMFGLVLSPDAEIQSGDRQYYIQASLFCNPDGSYTWIKERWGLSGSLGPERFVDEEQQAVFITTQQMISALIPGARWYTVAGFGVLAH